ncbi:MAG: hypothetical protein ACI9HK_004404 [Pirellulaceae bacterium]|jgi:hypothetical protein
MVSNKETTPNRTPFYFGIWMYFPESDGFSPHQVWRYAGLNESIERDLSRQRELSCRETGSFFGNPVVPVDRAAQLCTLKNTHPQPAATY